MKIPGEEQSIFRPGLAGYMAASLINRPYPVMAEMEKYAAQNMIPILGVDAGAVLAFIVRSLAPRSILELGTGLGYSTAWMISVLDGGKVTTVDRNRELQQKAWSWIDGIRGGVTVNMVNAHAVEYIENSGEEHDLVFVDCDKVAYPEILVHFLHKKQRWLVFDNVLWHGRIMDDGCNLPSDLSVREFWQIVRGSGLKTTLFPAGDGLLLIEQAG